MTEHVPIWASACGSTAVAMQSLPAQLLLDLLLDLVDHLCSVRDVVVMRSGSLVWRDVVKRGFSSWLKVQPVRVLLPSFTSREVGFMRDYVDSDFPSL